MARIYERADIITFDEFKEILFNILRKSLKAFPKEDVEEYLKSGFVEQETKAEYDKCVVRFRVSTLQYPNEVFSAGISKLENLLSLCFE